MYRPIKIDLQEFAQEKVRIQELGSRGRGSERSAAETYFAFTSPT
jgi:hypothetical protein